VCKAESECDTSAGFRIQRGRCAGSDFCCTPKNAGTNSDIIPNAFFERGALCYPLTEGSLTHTGSDFGNGRPRSTRNPNTTNKRCHAGQDLFTKSPGTVIAIADGEVTHVSSSFTTCRDGWGVRQFYGGRATAAGAIFIYHPSIDRTINYGEADGSQNKVRRGDRVRKGQVLTRASVCGMLHFEVYQGRRTSNVRWWGSRACRDAAARGNAYGCPRPPHAAEDNYCAKYAMDVKEDATIDPRPYLELLEGQWCSPN
jgi:murein DD-endopeptidase MepM/ murein hydrolase activator NlpD